MAGRRGYRSKLWYATKPTIAAVQGWCIGGGTALVLYADRRVAEDGPLAGDGGTPTTAM